MIKVSLFLFVVSCNNNYPLPHLFLHMRFGGGGCPNTLIYAVEYNNHISQTWDLHAFIQQMQLQAIDLGAIGDPPTHTKDMCIKQ